MIVTWWWNLLTWFVKLHRHLLRLLGDRSHSTSKTTSGNITSELCHRYHSRSHVWFSAPWFLHVHSPFCPHYLSLLAWSCSEQKGSKGLILLLTPQWIQPLLSSRVAVHDMTTWRLLSGSRYGHQGEPLACPPASCEEFIGSSEDLTHNLIETIWWQKQFDDSN